MKSVIFLVIIMLCPVLALADAGVIVEASGVVSVTNPGGAVFSAKAGTEFPDGATISTGINSSAVIFFKSGVIKRLKAEKKMVAKGLPKKGNTTLFSGLSSAVKDSSKKNRGPTAHMAIKKIGIPGSTPKPAINKTALNEDISKVETLNLSPASTAFLKAEVYYMYSQYSNVVQTIKPYCQPKTCTNSASKNLIQNAYMKLGNVKLASDY